MKKVTYNMDELMGFNEFDTAATMKNFQNQQMYFDKLTLFVKEATGYLKGYTPLVITNSEEECKNFLQDLQRIIRILLSLGMNDIVIDLEKLGDAAFQKDTKILEDGLLKFHCEMDILAKRISLAGVSHTSEREETTSLTYERHMLIADLLMKLGVDEKTAYQDSRKIEHAMSEKSFQRIKEYYRNHANCQSIV